MNHLVVNNDTVKIKIAVTLLLAGLLGCIHLQAISFANLTPETLVICLQDVGKLVNFKLPDGSITGLVTLAPGSCTKNLEIGGAEGFCFSDTEHTIKLDSGEIKKFEAMTPQDFTKRDVLNPGYDFVESDFHQVILFTNPTTATGTGLDAIKNRVLMYSY